jgi:hypothetical protein
MSQPFPVSQAAKKSLAIALIDAMGGSSRAFLEMSILALGLR